ncbi:aminopeptidase P family protein [Fibrobacter intestinalis]|uniref:aminopeptidase P family protein n=1 Tax=Fibrobacter intestinalis TaxID=28122 RepID=UPI0023F5260C|nr:aminopeptidase P family protein [Fibrobacter intestinalis]MDD7298409.1 Xaa-Pro aminopeptidase [Fibrobacter intestinalis]
MNRYSQVFIEPSGDVPATEIYRSRRKKLLKKLETIGLFAGVFQNPGSEEVFTEIGNKMVQDPSFLYLTGLNQPGCKLLLNPLAESEGEREVLFLPPKDALGEFWTGRKLAYSDDLDEVKERTGFQRIYPSTEFWRYLDASVKKWRLDTLEVFFLEFLTKNGVRGITGDHNGRFADELKAHFGDSCRIKSLAEKHFDLRVVLDPFQQKDSRKAQGWTAEAFRLFLKEMKNFRTERDAALFLNYQMQRQSDGDLAFPTIMACGENACCLHYVKNDEPLESGKLLLMDFGIRAGTQHSDISRTVPVGGKFNPLQKILYSIVLDAQKFHASQVKPGAFLRELDANVWNFIEKALDERFVQKGGKCRLLYDKRPHGVSHLIGEQIHEGDPFRVYMDKPLESGMLISNEPGIYGYFEIELSGVRYAENVGIRIENDLLVTPDGCEDISAAIPREIEEMELAMAEF